MSDAMSEQDDQGDAIAAIQKRLDCAEKRAERFRETLAYVLKRLRAIGGWQQNRDKERRSPEGLAARVDLLEEWLGSSTSEAKPPIVDGLRKALEDVPLPSVQGNPGEFYGRFYDWYYRVAVPALAPFDGPDGGGEAGS